jgi:hypothetical protein
MRLEVQYSCSPAYVAHRSRGSVGRRRGATGRYVVSHPSVVNLKFVQEQPQILRLRLPRNTRQTPLRMTTQFWCELQTRDTSDKNKDVARVGHPAFESALSAERRV